MLVWSAAHSAAGWQVFGGAAYMAFDIRGASSRKKPWHSRVCLYIAAACAGITYRMQLSTVDIHNVVRHFFAEITNDLQFLR